MQLPAAKRGHGTSLEHPKYEDTASQAGNIQIFILAIWTLVKSVTDRRKAACASEGFISPGFALRAQVTYVLRAGEIPRWWPRRLCLPRVWFYVPNASSPRALMAGLLPASLIV